MMFCEFLNILYDNSPKSGGSQYVMEIFSALCGEEDPIGTNKHEPKSTKISCFRASKFLPDGLNGKDSTLRRRLFGRQKKYEGINGVLKTRIRGKENSKTLTSYLNKTVRPKAYGELCSAFSVDKNTAREILFEAVYLCFVEFINSPIDDIDNSISDYVKILSAQKATVPQNVDSTTSLQGIPSYTDVTKNVPQEEIDMNELDNTRYFMRKLLETANEYNSRYDTRGLFPCDIIRCMKDLYSQIESSKFLTEKIFNIVENFEGKYWSYMDYIMENTREVSDLRYRMIITTLPRDEIVNELEKRKNELLRIVSKMEKLAAR